MWLYDPNIDEKSLGDRLDLDYLVCDGESALVEKSRLFYDDDSYRNQKQIMIERREGFNFLSVVFPLALALAIVVTQHISIYVYRSIEFGIIIINVLAKFISCHGETQMTHHPNGSEGGSFQWRAQSVCESSHAWLFAISKFHQHRAIDDRCHSL